MFNKEIHFERNVMSSECFILSKRGNVKQNLQTCQAANASAKYLLIADDKQLNHSTLLSLYFQQNMILLLLDL